MSILDPCSPRATPRAPPGGADSPSTPAHQHDPASASARRSTSRRPSSANGGLHNSTSSRRRSEPTGGPDSASSSPTYTPAHEHSTASTTASQHASQGGRRPSSASSNTPGHQDSPLTPTRRRSSVSHPAGQDDEPSRSRRPSSSNSLANSVSTLTQEPSSASLSASRVGGVPLRQPTSSAHSYRSTASSTTSRGGSPAAVPPPLGGSSSQRRVSTSSVTSGSPRPPSSRQQSSRQPLSRPTSSRNGRAGAVEYLDDEDEDPLQVLHDSMAVLLEVEGLIRDALHLAPDQPLDIMQDAEALSSVPPTLLLALEDTINVIMDARSELDRRSFASLSPSPSSVFSKRSAASRIGSAAGSSSSSSRTASARVPDHQQRMHQAAAEARRPHSQNPKPWRQQREQLRQAFAGNRSALGDGRPGQAAAAAERKRMQQMQDDLRFIQQMRARQTTQLQHHEQTLQEAEESIESLRSRQREAEVQHKWLSYQERVAEQARLRRESLAE